MKSRNKSFDLLYAAEYLGSGDNAFGDAAAEQLSSSISVTATRRRQPVPNGRELQQLCDARTTTAAAVWMDEPVHSVRQKNEQPM